MSEPTEDPKGKPNAQSEAAPNADNGRQPESGTDVEPKLFDADYVKELREENKARRLENKKLQEQINELKISSDTTVAKLKKALGLDDADADDDAAIQAAQTKAAQIETKARNALLKAAFVQHAAAKNFADPERAFRLLDADDIEVDLDSGQAKGVREAVEALAEECPWLIAATDDKGQPAPNLKTGGGNPPADRTGASSHKEALAAIKKEAAELYPRDPVRQSTHIMIEKKKLGITTNQ